MNKNYYRYSVFVLALFAIFFGGYFWNQIENASRGSEKEVDVKGIEVDSQDQFNKNITFENLLESQPDAPVKKDGFGNFYARAKAAIAIDADTNTILHYQNAKERTAVASLTKVMTAIVVLENIDNLEEEIVTVDKEAVFEEGTKIGCPRSGYCISNRLQVGEQLKAWDLFQAMIMNSANDAAVALGRHIAGSEEEFADLMNQKAREIGLEDTHFCNPSGLDEEDNPGGCYSTAYDMARISAYSLKYDEIWDTMKIQGKDIYSVDNQITHHLINTDILLDQMPNCMGGKTGFTYEAGKSLMTGAFRPGDSKRRVIGVILDDYYRWEDMKKMMNWVFSAYSWP